MKKYTSEELQAEIKRLKARVASLERYVQCDDCKRYVNLKDIAQNEAWSTLCDCCAMPE